MKKLLPRSVPDEYKPMIFSQGVPKKFPAPTIRVQHPKVSDETEIWGDYEMGPEIWGGDQIMQHSKCTPPKINIEPENGDLEDDFPFPGLYIVRLHVGVYGKLE